MRKMVVVAVLVVATVTTAWAMSELLSKPTIATKAGVGSGGGYGGYGLPPTRLTPLW